MLPGDGRQVNRDQEKTQRVVDRADYDPDRDPGGPIVCERCGGEMHYTAACKIMCGRCGYKRDCSDP